MALEKEALGEELGDVFCRFYDITERGNFEEGRSIPHMDMSLPEVFAQQGLAAAP